jgi:rhodanese-related sulfurtransferase
MATNQPNETLITPNQVRTAQHQANAPLIIDVRSDAEYAAGHVEGAVHIPIDELPDRLAALERERPVVTYCMMKHPGASRGERAAALLREQGYDARALDGGLPGWEAAGMPVATGID